MNQNDVKWLEELTKLPTVSGREENVVAWVTRWVERRKDLRLKSDDAGNLMISQQRRSAKRPLLVTAHLDHPGFLVTASAGPKNSFVEFRGGVKEAYFEDAALHFFVDGKTEPARLVSFDHKTGVGLVRSRAHELPVGTLGRWAFAERTLGIRGNSLRAPGCDDLAGVAAALSVIDRARKGKGLGHVAVLLTRAEEVGFVGALAACANGSIPADARLICLETSRSFAESPVGGGPIIRVGDALSVFSPELTNRITGIARKNGGDLVWQRKLMAGGACEATAFSANGYESTCICLPLGNYHNMGNLDEVEAGTGEAKPKPEVISLSDHAGLIDLLMLTARHLDDKGEDLASRLNKRFEESKHFLEPSPQREPGPTP